MITDKIKIQKTLSLEILLSKNSMWKEILMITNMKKNVILNKDSWQCFLILNIIQRMNISLCYMHNKYMEFSIKIFFQSLKIKILIH